MPPKTGKAKAAPAKRARKKPAKKQVVAAAKAKDWPPGLTNKQREELFELLEGGDYTVRTAAREMGIKGNNVYQWKHRFPVFAARLDEAIDIGIDMMADSELEIADTSIDRDSSAAAKERCAARERYRRHKRPERFNVSPFKASGGDSEGMTLVGVVIVPAKSDTAGLPPERRVIQGQAREIKRLPVNTTQAPSFKVKADG